jgi:hypothetical protein
MKQDKHRCAARHRFGQRKVDVDKVAIVRVPTFAPVQHSGQPHESGRHDGLQVRARQPTRRDV